MISKKWARCDLNSTHNVLLPGSEVLIKSDYKTRLAKKMCLK